MVYSSHPETVARPHLMFHLTPAAEMVHGLEITGLSDY